MRDCISRTEVINAIHATIYKFFNVPEDPEPFNDKDKLLLNVNKAITNAIKELQAVQLVSDVPDINDGNKNCILDKIRAEIEHLTYYWCEVNPRTVIDDVLQIIDKYNIESEE